MDQFISVKLLDLMQKAHLYLFSLLLLIACNTLSELEECGQHYQKHQDYESLQKVVELLPLATDTSTVRTILGAPIDMGFDFRYLVDSTGVNDCVIGAVFHIDESGKIDQKWIDEICE